MDIVHNANIFFISCSRKKMSNERPRTIKFNCQPMSSSPDWLNKIAKFTLQSCIAEEFMSIESIFLV